MTRIAIRPLLLALFALATLVALPASAHAEDLSVSVNPGPPAAVKNNGTGVQRYTYTINFTGTPRKVRRRVIAPDNTVVAGSESFRDITGAASPYVATESYTVPAGAAPGRYVVEVYFYNSQVCNSPTCPLPAENANYAAVGKHEFTVAAALGNINTVKFEDVNGDGIRQGSEPGVPNWGLQFQTPSADLTSTSTFTRNTTGDGTYNLTGVPAGPQARYTVSEIIPNPNPANWAPTTAASQSFTLADGQTRNVVFGNARLSSLCGTVYHDVNRNGTRDGNEPVFTEQVALNLGGADGRGNAASGRTVSNAQGRYCFNNLMPGSYSVLEGVPAGWEATGDKDGAANGLSFINPIGVLSGQPSDGNDFGLARPASQPQPEPRTKLCITKRVNDKTARQGQTVTWTVKVRNCGTATAYEVAVIDPLLRDATLRTRGGATLVRGQLVWSTGKLAPGKSKTYKFKTRFDRDARAGKHTNRARAEARNASTVKAKASTVVNKLKRKPVKVAVTG